MEKCLQKLGLTQEADKVASIGLQPTLLKHFYYQKQQPSVVFMLIQRLKLTTFHQTNPS